MSDPDQRPPEGGDDFFASGEHLSVSIPPVEQVLLPPEEIRRVRRRRGAAALAGLVALGLIAWAVTLWVHAASVKAAALAAGDSGRVEDFDQVFAVLDPGEAPGLRARLAAQRAHAGLGSLEDAQAALASLPDSDDEDLLIGRYQAEAYAALAQGDALEAYEAAARLFSVGTYGAETAHVKSLAALAHGDQEVARDEAKDALAARPDAPRYRAQLATALAIAGAIDEALETLGAARVSHPALELAEARALALGRREGAAGLARSVREDEAATPRERAWAALVEAEGDAFAGDRTAARAAVQAALAQAPPGEAHFSWHAAEVLLYAEDPATARATVQGLPTEGPVTDAALRGRVRAALALDQGDAARALTILSTVPAEAASWLLVAQARQVLDQPDEARSFFDQAAEAPAFRAEALALKARLELAEGNVAAAAEAARSALDAAPHHPAWVPVAVDTQLAGDAPAGALGLADAALEVHPGDVRLLSAKADALFALERWEDALVVLREATETVPEDVVLQARRGEAARRAEVLGEAREALDAALALDGEHRPALVSRLALDVRERRLADAEEMVRTLKGLRERGAEFQRWLGRYHVARGSGYAGVRDLNRSLRQFRRDAEPRLLLAELFLQAELYTRALGLFRAAARMRRATRAERVAALLGVAIAHARDRKTNRVGPALEEAEEAATAEADVSQPEPPLDLDTQPRYALARAWVAYNLGRAPAAEGQAEEALRLAGEGPVASEAHLLLALVDQRRRRNPDAHLRAAAEGPYAQPLAQGLLMRRLGDRPEACVFARRYLTAAPRGDARQDARARLRDCPDE